MDMQKDTMFSKRNTNVIKGIAILILCWHHLFWHNVTVPVDLKTSELMDILVPVTKVCVALFTMLSGYGIYESFKKGKTPYGKFTFLHVKKLLINYWWIYIPVFILSFWFHRQGTPIQVYGTGIIGLRNFLLEFLGLRAMIYSPTLNNTWWYMEAAVVFYLFFPLIHKLLNKFPAFLMGISALPVLLASVNIFWSGFITTDREIFYLFDFIVGMELSRRGILNRLVIYCKKNQKEFIGYALVLFAIACVVRTQVSLIWDTAYAFSIIVLGIGIASLEGILKKALEFLGKHSMNIFLIHSMIYYYFSGTKQLLDSIEVVLFKYVALVFICLGCSVLVEWVKSMCKKWLILGR